MLAAARLARRPGEHRLLFELSAIAAVVVAARRSRWQVRIAGTVAGVVLMQLVSATLIKNNLPNSSALMVQAVIIIAAVWAHGSGRGERACERISVTAPARSARPSAARVSGER